MTIAELMRAIESKKRINEHDFKQRAIFDYNLAELIGRSVARCFSSQNTMPQLYELYPALFDSEDAQEKQQQKRDELSALRFRQFAQSFNKKYTEGVNNEK